MKPVIKLDENNVHHQMLVGVFAMFVDDYGYSPRELFLLIDDAKLKTFHSLRELHKEREAK